MIGLFYSTVFSQVMKCFIALQISVKSSATSGQTFLIFVFNFFDLEFFDHSVCLINLLPNFSFIKSWTILTRQRDRTLAWIKIQVFLFITRLTSGRRSFSKWFLCFEIDFHTFVVHIKRLRSTLSTLHKQKLLHFSTVYRPKLCGNCAFPQNFHIIKLGKIMGFYTMYLCDGKGDYLLF